MTSSAKEAIYRIVDGLSEDEAAELLAYLDRRAAQRGQSIIDDRPRMIGESESLEEIKERLSRPRTPEERERALAALEQARILRDELLRRRGGRLFPSSGKILDELRAEREREL